MICSGFHVGLETRDTYTGLVLVVDGLRCRRPCTHGSHGTVTGGRGDLPVRDGFDGTSRPCVRVSRSVRLGGQGRRGRPVSWVWVSSRSRLTFDRHVLGRGRGRR